MIRERPSTSSLWRRLAPALAVLAVAVRILVPPGFMLAPSPTAGAIPLAICTGHGVLQTGDSAQAPHPGGKRSSADAPCAFAGHGAGAAPDLLTVSQASFAAYQPTVSAPVRRGLAPGRGLAAPPLPARGPPQPIH